MITLCDAKYRIKLYLSFLFLLVLCPLGYALDIGIDSSDVGVVMEIPDTPINYSTIATVNSSDFWDNLNDPSDISVLDLSDFVSQFNVNILANRSSAVTFYNSVRVEGGFVVQGGIGEGISLIADGGDGSLVFSATGVPTLTSNAGLGNANINALGVDLYTNQNVVFKVRTSKANGFATLWLANDARRWDIRVNSDDELEIRDQTTGATRFTIDTSGKTTVFKNATFNEDIIIDGLLYGGTSPVKVAGINITNNVFFHRENINNSARFTIQNINESTNATAGFTVINDVGMSATFGIGSSQFMVGDTNYKNATFLVSRSRGITGFANLYNEGFLWLYNPIDDGNPDNLVELMRLDANGLNATVNITSENIFLPQSIFPHTNRTVVLVSANVWVNVTFDQEETAIKRGITHTYNDNTNHTFTINEDGEYFLDFDYDVIDTSASSTDIDVAGRVIYANGTEISGSVFESDITKKDIETEISHNLLANLRKGDIIVFQFVAEDVDVVISTHGTFGDHPDSASIIIEKINNI